MSSETEVRPFRVDFPDEEVAELRRRNAATGGPSARRSPTTRRACGSR